MHRVISNGENSTMAESAKAINQIAVRFAAPSASVRRYFLKPNRHRAVYQSFNSSSSSPYFPGRDGQGRRGERGGEHYRRVCSANNGRFFLPPLPSPVGRPHRCSGGSQSPRQTLRCSRDSLAPTGMRSQGTSRRFLGRRKVVSWWRRGGFSILRSATHRRGKTVGRELSTTRMSWLAASSSSTAVWKPPER